MQVLNTAHPTSYFLRFLVSIFNGVNVHGCRANNILTLHVLKLKHSLVFVVEGRLVQHRNTKIFFGTIGLGHLEERIHFSYSRDVLRNEGLQLGF